MTALTNVSTLANKELSIPSHPSKNVLAFSMNPDKLLPTSGSVEVAPATTPPAIPPKNLPIATPISCKAFPPSPNNHLNPGI